MKRESLINKRASGVSWTLKILGLVLVCFLFPASMFAQDGASLQGTISDQLGAKVAGAEVRVLPRSGGEVSTRTDRDGKFAFANLKPGDYLIEVKAEGFAEITSPLNKLLQKDIAFKWTDECQKHSNAYALA